jgi:hypothetical protein
MSDAPKVEFDAYLPPIQSAIKVSGEGDTMRIQLEINLRTSPDAFRIAMFTGKRLHITIEELPEEPKVKNGRGKPRESDKNKADGDTSATY